MSQLVGIQADSFFWILTKSSF